MTGAAMGSGCLVEGDEIYPGSSRAAAGGAGGEDAPTWTEVGPIFEGRCGACHGALLARGAPFPLIDYENARLHAVRSAIRIESMTMPPPGQGFDPCTAEEAALIRAWADAGAPE